MGATKYKYILIFINVIVIAISICVLIYVHQTDNSDFIEYSLIGVSLAAYCLSIIGSVAIGLENICLLTLHALILSISLVASCSYLVISILNALVHVDPLITYENSLVSILIVIMSVQVMSTYYLIYQIIMERRVDLRHQYRLTTALNIDDL